MCLRVFVVQIPSCKYNLTGTGESLTFGESISLMILRNILIVVAGVFILTGCKNKKKPSPTGDEPVEVTDFIEYFPTVQLSYQINDSTWKKKEKDSLLIKYNVFTQFIPDTILHKVFNKNVKPKIYPLGRVIVPGGETYLFAKMIAGEKKAVYVLSFDKKQQFIAGMSMLRPGMLTAMQSLVMDRRYTITKSVLRRNADGTLSEGKEVWVLNADAKNFTLIMTEALDDKLTELINPIDTLPRKHKFSGDYTAGKMNLVSVRDGRKSDRLSFFIHFEKNNGECTGELKGEALLRTPATAEYKVDGDPCVLRFTFSSSSVTLKEIDGCGSRRGLRCAFDGSFAKKKTVAPKPKNTKRK